MGRADKLLSVADEGFTRSWPGLFMKVEGHPQRIFPPNAFSVADLRGAEQARSGNTDDILIEAHAWITAGIGQKIRLRA